MVKTLSTMLPLGTKAPDFRLPDTISGEPLKLSSYTVHSKAIVVMFICNHCPFVKHVNEELVKLAQDYSKEPVSFIAISANDVKHYPEDSPENMRKVAKELHYPFPYLYDETQEVALLFQAACTPDFFVLDQQHNLVYRGQLDDSRPGNGIPVTGKDLRHAIDCLLEKVPNLEPQKPSIGCNIKWKANI